MDRLEIGHPIIDALLIDILGSLKHHIDQNQTEILQTANMFLDMIDPWLIWSKVRGLLILIADSAHRSSAGNAQVESERAKSKKYIDLLVFVMTKVKFSDEEVLKFHLPYIFFIQCHQLLRLHLSSPLLSSFVHLLSLSLDLIPSTNWTPQISDAMLLKSAQPSTVSLLELMGPDVPLLDQISAFYADQKYEIELMRVIDIRRVFKHSSHALQSFLSAMIKADFKVSIKSFERIAGLIGRLFEVGQDMILEDETSLSEWTTSLVDCVRGNEYEIVSIAISSLLQVTQKMTPSLQGVIGLDGVELVFMKLWHFLNKDHTLHHLRIASLIQSLCNQTGTYLIESLIVRQLIRNKTPEEFDKFGVFYRIGNELIEHISMKFSRPVFLICDLLACPIALERRIGETWLRNYAKELHKYVIPSFFFLLFDLTQISSFMEPLLRILLSVEIQRSPSTVIVCGDSMLLYTYDRPFNQAQVDYAFVSLNRLAEFGDRMFAKAIWSHDFKDNIGELGLLGALKSHCMLASINCLFSLFRK